MQRCTEAWKEAVGGTVSSQHTSLLGLAYYLRLIVVLVDRPAGEPYVSPSPPLSVRLAKAMVIVGALGLVVLSAWPNLLLSNLP